MNTWSLRLFTVFWWLLVIGSADFALFGIVWGWTLFPRDLVLLLSPLPFIAMTLIRWIITARWRFGPCW